MAKLKVISDGTVAGTSVVDAVTGDPVEGIVSVHLRVVNDEWIVDLELAKPGIDITVESLVRAR